MTENEIIDAISFINAHKDIVGYNIARKTTELIYKYNGYPDLDDIEHKRLYDFYEKHKEVCKCGDSYRLIELYTCGFTNTYVYVMYVMNHMIILIMIKNAGPMER